MTPSSRQEYSLTHAHMLYRNEANMARNIDSTSRGSRTSFGSTSNSSHESTSSQQIPLAAFYNERIEKTTSFDDDSASEEALSCSSSVYEEDNEVSDIGLNIARKVSLLRKEIDAVKNSLVGLQNDHVVMLNEKNHLEQQYQEAKNEVAKNLETSTNDLLSYKELLNVKVEKLSLELVLPSISVDNSDNLSDNDGELPEEYTDIMNNCVLQAKELEILQAQLEKSKQDFKALLDVKEEIEHTLEGKEREYSERIRQCEAVISGQSGMIDQMESLLRELEGKMDKLINEKIQQQQAAAAIARQQQQHQQQMAAAAAARQQQGHLRQQSNINTMMSHHSTHNGHNSRQKSSSFLAHQRQRSSLSSLTQLNSHHHHSDNSKQPSVDAASSHRKSSISSTVSSSIACSGPRKSNRLQEINHLEGYNSSELMPSYCLSPPQTRRHSYTNPITLFTDEERVRHQTRFSLAKLWVEDEDVSECQQAGCSVAFNWWNRRHHCRRCGNIFCNTHSSHSMLLFPDCNEDCGGVWSRVCEGCFKDTR